MLHKYLFFTVFSLAALICQQTFAQQNVFLPMHASRIRAIGMASAYQAMRDDLAAISLNPASYSVYRESKKFRVTFFLAPATPAMIYQDAEAFFGRPARQSEKNAAALFALLKAVNFTYKDLDIGLLFGEPSFSPSSLAQSSKVLNINNVYHNHYDALALRLRLAEQVAIGVSVYLNYFETETTQRDWALAASYGVTLQPNDYLRVGISLFSAAAKVPRNYEFIDEKYNDAIGLGLALQMPWNMLFSFDVRNLTVNQDVDGERLLAGIEQEIFGQIAIRAGVQYHTNDRDFSQTLGLGLLNLSAFRSDRVKFNHAEYAINYALMRKKLLDEYYLIHALSLQVRI